MTEYGRVFPGLYIGTRKSALDRELLRYELSISHLVVIEGTDKITLPKAYAIDFETLKVDDITSGDVTSEISHERFEKVHKFIDVGRNDGTGVFIFG
jgi:hypothetical protein